MMFERFSSRKKKKDEVIFHFIISYANFVCYSDFFLILLVHNVSAYIPKK